MLIDLQQVGCILGKGGEVINTLRKETGAQIRVIDKRDLPPCAGKDDALIIVRSPLQHPFSLYPLGCAPLGTSFQTQEDQSCAFFYVLYLICEAAICTSCVCSAKQYLQVSANCLCPIVFQVKADREAAVDALKQLSALLRTHSQRRPQQVRHIILQEAPVHCLAASWQLGVLSLGAQCQ